MYGIVWKLGTNAVLRDELIMNDNSGRSLLLTEMYDYFVEINQVHLPIQSSF